MFSYQGHGMVNTPTGICWWLSEIGLDMFKAIIILITIYMYQLNLMNIKVMLNHQEFDGMQMNDIF